MLLLFIPNFLGSGINKPGWESQSSYVAFEL